MMLRFVMQGLQDPLLRSYTILIRLKTERWLTALVPEQKNYAIYEAAMYRGSVYEYTVI